MKTRTITAVVALAVFVLILYVLPPVVAVVAFCALCAIAAYELLGATGALRGHPLLWVCCLFAAIVPIAASVKGIYGILGLIFAYTVVSFVWAVFDHERLDFAKLAEGFVGAVLIPLLLSSVLRILIGYPFGRYLILMPFLTAWCCDTMAYFAGRAFGKHKLAPYVSPKKTVEGAIGGLLGGVVGLVVFALVMTRTNGMAFRYEILIPAGVIAAALGQFGDLSMSLIKRKCGIKDYGKLFPGHGGVLDRFDSVLFTAPFFEIVLALTGILR